MFKGDKVMLRSMKEADITRMDEFAQDADLAGLDCGYAAPRSLERIRADAQNWTTTEDPHQVFFAIEADRQYVDL